MSIKLFSYILLSFHCISVQTADHTKKPNKIRIDSLEELRIFLKERTEQNKQQHVTCESCKVAHVVDNNQTGNRDIKQK